MVPQRINLQNIQLMWFNIKKKADCFNSEIAKYLRMTYKERKLT